MSFPDTPDYARGIVAAQILLASVDAAADTVTVDLPSTVTALWLYGAADNSTPVPSVVGVTSGTLYPVYATLIDSTGSGSVGPTIALVSPVLDNAVTVTRQSGLSAAWWVVGDTSMRVTASLPLTVYTPV